MGVIMLSKFKYEIFYILTFGSSIFAMPGKTLEITAKAVSLNWHDSTTETNTSRDRTNDSLGREMLTDANPRTLSFDAVSNSALREFNAQNMSAHNGSTAGSNTLVANGSDYRNVSNELANRQTSQANMFEQFTQTQTQYVNNLVEQYKNVEHGQAIKSYQNNLDSADQVLTKDIPQLTNHLKSLEGELALAKETLSKLQNEFQTANTNLSTSKGTNIVSKIVNTASNFFDLKIDKAQNYKKNIVDQIKTIEAKIFSYEKAIAITKAKLDVAQNYVKPHLDKTQLNEVQKVLSNLEAHGMLAEPQLKDVTNLTKFDEGRSLYAAKNDISPNAKTFLSKHNIPHQKFESMDKCNAMQKHLYEQTGIIVNEVADVAIKFETDSKIQAYAEAAAQWCNTSVDMIKSGTPAQAIVATKFASVWHLLAHLEAKMDIGIIKGIPGGIVIGAALAAAPQLVMPVLAAKLAYDVASVGLYLKDGGFAKSFEEFNKLTPDQQLQRIEQFVENYGTFVGGFLTAGPQIGQKLDSAIASSTKALKMELAGLQAFAKTEQVELAGLKGITAPKLYAQELNGLVQAGKITTQSDVQGYILAKQAPALCTFVESEAIGSQTALKGSQLDKAGMTVKMGSVERKVASEFSVEIKIAHEAVSAKSEIAAHQVGAAESKAAGELVAHKSATVANSDQQLSKEAIQQLASKLLDQIKSTNQPTALDIIDRSIGDIKKIEKAIEMFKNIPGTMTKDGPIRKLIENGIKGSNSGALGTARGAAAELELAYDLINKGAEIVAFGEKLRIKECAREFDIITKTKLIECKNIDWSKKIGLEAERFKSQVTDQKIIANAFNKHYELHSRSIIPESWKSWLKEKNITFVEG